MPSIGPLEILVVSVLGLIVFGPDKLPEIARTVGAFFRQVQSMAEDVKQEFSDGFEVSDEPEDEELAAITQEDDDSGIAELTDEPAAALKDEPAADEPAEEQPAEHPVAEVIRAERDAKESGREA
jgi:sec-independent protein translocase protein TatB